MEDDHKIEKSTILSDLDRITNNYQIYAESHKNYTALEEQFNAFREDYEHNCKVIESHTQSLSYIIFVI